MGAHSGRCFRDRKRTARRKTHQQAAWADYQHRHSPVAVSGRIAVLMVGVKLFHHLPQVAKQRVVEAYRASRARA